MSNSEPVFDPYYTWLGIPQAEQPPSHYRLLGISLFESNPDVIVNAAERQTRHLRSVASGPRSAHSQQMLNEVASARICLLNPTTKAAYDQSLRSATIATHHLNASITPPVPPNVPPASSELPVPIAPIAAAGPQEVPPTMLPVGANSSPSASTMNPSTRYVLKRQRSGGKTRVHDKSVQKTISIVIGGLMGCAIGWFIISVFMPKFEERKTQTQRSGSSKEVPREHRRPASPSPPGEKNRPPTPDPRRGSPGDSLRDKASPPPVPDTTPNLEPKEFSPLPSNPSTPDVTPSTQANYPTFVSLPEVSSTPGYRIANLPQVDAKTSLQLLYADSSPAGTRLLTEESSESESRVWTVSLTTDQDSKSILSKAIAEFLIVTSELQFKWLPSAGSNEKALLTNCALMLSVGEEEHTIALRKPQIVESLNFDMDDPHEKHDFTVENCPSEDRLVLELGDLTGLPAKAHYKNEKSEATVGKNVVIEFEELPGAELEVRFFALESDKVGIVVSPIFRENAASRVAMTKSQLEKTLLSVQRTILNTQAEIQQRSNEAARLEGLSTSRMNAAQVAGLRGKINQLRTQINSYQGRLAQLQANLAAGPRIRDFIDSLHDKVYLHFKVKSFADERTQITLIASEGAADSI